MKKNTKKIGFWEVVEYLLGSWSLLDATLLVFYQMIYWLVIPFYFLSASMLIPEIYEKLPFIKDGYQLSTWAKVFIWLTSRIFAGYLLEVVGGV
jgi:hypothetical protein